jgi:hypothetical protein
MTKYDEVLFVPLEEVRLEPLHASRRRWSGAA